MKRIAEKTTNFWILKAAMQHLAEVYSAEEVKTLLKSI